MKVLYKNAKWFSDCEVLQKLPSYAKLLVLTFAGDKDC